VWLVGWVGQEGMLGIINMIGMMGLCIALLLTLLRHSITTPNNNTQPLLRHHTAHKPISIMEEIGLATHVCVHQHDQ
jgi:hypothetical protein